uniref:Ankyrin repeat domain 40 n=1 Tax=Tetraodon nigroviridis TaxID=99883 RepID=H3D517_TETNG
MSSISLDKELQERLREASAIGDIDEVRTLVESGVNINSQNEINGWTCLHWACKRNHKHIVTYLLACGADIEILTAKDELASQLTSKPEIKRLLGVEVEEVPEVKEPELPIIPNYLSNPPFIYSKLDNKSELITDQHVTQNGSGVREEDSEPASLSPTLEPQESPSMRSDPPAAVSNPSPHATEFLPVAEQNVQAPVAGPNPAMSRQQSIPQQLGHSQPGGAVPAFQPFFFTSTFPVNVQELVLKVRIQNPSARENDFIEVELDRQELTYRSLLRVCCRELGISAEHVEKIRKLPNTMLRKDKDVARLQDFQELEVVLEKAEGLSFFSGGGLTDRPCYNMKASRLTY